jgi:hypothetical protein
MRTVPPRGGVLALSLYPPLPQGVPFNFIFSDGLHTKDAILLELNQILERRLLDPDNFIYVWDDMGPHVAENHVCDTFVQRFSSRPT